MMYLLDGLGLGGLSHTSLTGSMVPSASIPRVKQMTGERISAGVLIFAVRAGNADKNSCSAPRQSCGESPRRSGRTSFLLFHTRDAGFEIPPAGPPRSRNRKWTSRPAESPRAKYFAPRDTAARSPRASNSRRCAPDESAPDKGSHPCRYCPCRETRVDLAAPL